MSLYNILPVSRFTVLAVMAFLFSILSGCSNEGPEESVYFNWLESAKGNNPNKLKSVDIVSIEAISDSVEPEFKAKLKAVYSSEYTLHKVVDEVITQNGKRKIIKNLINKGDDIVIEKIVNSKFKADQWKHTLLSEEGLSEKDKNYLENTKSHSIRRALVTEKHIDKNRDGYVLSENLLAIEQVKAEARAFQMKLAMDKAIKDKKIAYGKKVAKAIYSEMRDQTPDHISCDSFWENGQKPSNCSFNVKRVLSGTRTIFETFIEARPKNNPKAFKTIKLLYAFNWNTKKNIPVWFQTECPNGKATKGFSYQQIADESKVTLSCEDSKNKHGGLTLSFDIDGIMKKHAPGVTLDS